jgi:hypothetical protein
MNFGNLASLDSSHTLNTFQLSFPGFCANAYKRQPLGCPSVEFHKDRGTDPKLYNKHARQRPREGIGKYITPIVYITTTTG